MTPMDIILLLVFAGVTWAVAGEGPWGSALVLFSVVLSGLLAMNLFEPLAEKMSGGSYDWSVRSDIMAFLGLFSLSVWGLREATERIMPTTLEVVGLLHETRWLFGAVTGYAMVAILLTALHTAPLPREFLGFRPERMNLLDTMAPDRQWLGFTQYVSERVMRSGTYGPIFDGANFAILSPNTPEAVAYPLAIQNPDGQRLTTAQVWSSFPMRYAQRRDQFMGGGTVVPSAPLPVIAPVPGSGGSQPAF